MTTRPTMTREDLEREQVRLDQAERDRQEKEEAFVAREATKSLAVETLRKKEIIERLQLTLEMDVYKDRPLTKQVHLNDRGKGIGNITMTPKNRVGPGVLVEWYEDDDAAAGRVRSYFSTFIPATNIRGVDYRTKPTDKELFEAAQMLEKKTRDGKD